MQELIQFSIGHSIMNLPGMLLALIPAYLVVENVSKLKALMTLLKSGVYAAIATMGGLISYASHDAPGQRVEALELVVLAPTMFLISLIVVAPFVYLDKRRAKGNG